jgi:hypothetical protein
MSQLAYLVLGFLVVMVIGTGVLADAMRRAEDGFENEQGFQPGIAPGVLSLYPFPSYAPAMPVRAAVPEITTPISPRRPPGSKPPMLPPDLTVADLNPSTERKPNRRRRKADTNQQHQDTQPPFSDSADTPHKL